MALKELPAHVSEEEMKAAKVPLPFRDRCAGLLIPLNKCRRETAYLPWKCGQLRHDYEECEYLDFQRRVQEFKQQQE